MNALLHLLYCTEILVALLFLAMASDKTVTHGSTYSMDPETPTETSPVFSSNSTPPSSSPQPSVTAAPTSTASASTASSTSAASTASTTAPDSFFKKECLTLYMVAGGLIIGCVILLLSTVLLCCKVCQLSRRLKTLRMDADLISNSDYWMGTAKRNKNKSETEAKETTVLMTGLSQTQGDTGNGTTAEEGEKANKDGQKVEENEKGAGGTAEGEDVSAAKETTVTENSSSSQPQKDATDSQATDAAADLNSGHTE